MTPLSLWRTLSSPTPHRGTVIEIADGVAKSRGLCLADILRKDARLKVARVRNEAFAVCREQGYSLHQIGRRFGRDHTTVLSGARKHQLSTDASVFAHSVAPKSAQAEVQSAA